MYYLRTEESFDAAHFLKGYEGKCRNLHGHRWRVVAHLKGEALSREKQTRGMLMDFGTVKDLLKELCGELDHSLIYEAGSLRSATLAALREEEFRLVEVPFRPTAEELARWFYQRLQEKGCPMQRLEVYETPNNAAAYEE